MAGRVVAAELRRIEPRCLASVEKKGIVAAEAEVPLLPLSACRIRRAPQGAKSILGRFGSRSIRLRISLIACGRPSSYAAA